MFNKFTKTSYYYLVACEIDANCFDRVSVLLLVITSSLWILVLSSVSGDSLYHHIQKTSAFLGPPVAAMFVAAIFWTRATEPVSSAETSGSTILKSYFKLSM